MRELDQPPSSPNIIDNEPGQPLSQAAIRFDVKKPLVVYILMGVTIFVFLLQAISQYGLFDGLDIPAAWGMKANSLIVKGQWWRLFTPMLLHGSVLHLGFNMYALYIFGRGLEPYYGRARFLILYILAGFCGNAMSFFFSPANSYGASTAIFGLLGAEGMFLYQNQRLFGANARTALANILMIAVVNLVIGLSPGIDNWGHIGGLIGGFSFAWLAGPVFRIEGSPPLFYAVDAHSTREVISAILGVGGLFAILTGALILMRG